MQLNFKIKDDHIQLLNAAITPINKSVNYLTAAFDFDDVWDGTRVTAVFCGRNNAPVSVLLDGITNICVIPWEALQSDVLKVSAYGIKENNGMTVRITSNTVELKLDKAGPVEGAEPATPSFTSWEQVVSRINDIEAGIVTDGSIGIAKLGDDVMQILNGKAEQSDLNETNEDITDIKNMALFYEECDDIDNPPWRTGVFTNDDRSVIVLSTYKRIIISQIGNMVSYDEYCFQLKISSSSIKKRSFSYRSGTQPPTPEWTDLIDTTELSDALEAETTDRQSADDELKSAIDTKADKQTKSGGFAGGKGASANAGGAVGRMARTSNGFAGGDRAICENSDKIAIDAIQLGTGTNANIKTLQIYNYTLMNADGTIPYERYGAAVDVKIAEAKSIIPKRYIVSELPTADIDENGTYLVPANEPNTDNIYTEYAYINNAWEIIGNPFEVDLSGYATQDDLTQSHDSLHSEIETGLTDLSNEIYTELNTKENRISIDTVSDTEYSACFNNNVQYRLGEVTSLTLNLPDNIPDDYISSVIFTSGATATNLIYPDTIKMLGEDCIECIFTPAANKRYEIIISYDGVNVVGVVGGYAI